MRRAGGVLAAVLLVGVAFAICYHPDRTVTVRALIGSEKAEFFNDPAVTAELDKRGFKVVPDTTGSWSMTSTNLDGYGLAFPASLPPAEEIRKQHNISTEPVRPFYSPLVVVAHAPVARGRSTGDLVVLYPDTTVSSDHTAIGLTPDGDRLAQLLRDDEKLRSLEARFGFRPQADPGAFTAALDGRPSTAVFVREAVVRDGGCLAVELGVLHTGGGGLGLLGGFCRADRCGCGPGFAVVAALLRGAAADVGSSDWLAQAYRNQLRRPSRTVYVPDTSGSTAGSRLDALKGALSRLTGTDDTRAVRRFRDREEVTLISFASTVKSVRVHAVPPSAPEAEPASIRADVQGC
ncbi:hypothetical protein P3T39_004116 [Kitasatospora sp. GP82]|nr:hypothetical protein [Kitasatospora sp. GP82]